MYWYQMPADMRLKCGDEGRRWAENEGGINATNMCSQFVDGMEYVFRNWKKRRPFDLYSSDDYVGNRMEDPAKMGFEIPKIDTAKIFDKLQETNTKLMHI